jgi:hypothetical protein
VGDGPGWSDHRPADVLRDRPGPADASHLPRCQTIPVEPDHRGNSRARGPVGHARAGAAAPRTADRHRSVGRRPRPHPGDGRGGGDTDGDRRGAAVRQARLTVGRRRRAGHIRAGRVRAPRHDRGRRRGGGRRSRRPRTVAQPVVRNHPVQCLAAGFADARQGPGRHLHRRREPMVPTDIRRAGHTADSTVDRGHCRHIHPRPLVRA